MTQKRLTNSARANKRAFYPTLAITSLLVLAACGSGTDGKDATLMEILPTAETRVGDNSPAADSITTENLQRNAARNAAQSLSVNLGGMQRVRGDSNVVALSAFSTQKTLFNDDSGTNSADEEQPAAFRLPELATDELDGDIEHFLFAALGVDGTGSSQAVREGNRITIDPDDAEVCAGELFVVDDDESAANQAQCMALVSHLSVQLDAETEQRGQVTFLFDGAPLLELGYGPRNAWYEVKLGALHQVMQLAQQLGIDNDSGVTVMQGSVRLSSTVINNTAGNESGSLTLVIPEALLIEDMDGSRLSVAASTVFTAASDAAAGTASLEFGLGALQLLAPVDASGQSTSPSTMALLTAAGLTGRIDLSNNGQQLTVSNLSFGRDSLRYSVASQVELELALAPLGFSFSEQSGKLVLNTDLDLALASSVYDASTGSTNLSLRAAAPAGTTLLADAEPNQLVQNGGPLNLTYSTTAPASSDSGFMTFNVGSCVDSSNQGQSNSLFGSLFSCAVD
jgi:hypothetical protein